MKRGQLWRYQIVELAKADFKLRYHGSVLGYFWALLKPLLLFLILNFVFARVFRDSEPRYSLHLLVGLVAWTYFVEGTRVGISALVAKAAIIKKLPISLMAVITAAILNASITSLINFGIVLAFLLWYGIPITLPSLLVAMILVMLEFGIIFGISVAGATFFARYIDIGEIWEVVLMVAFYAAPIIYPLNLIPPQFQPLLWLNPVAYLIHYLKLALVEQQLIPAERLILLIFVTAITCGGGWLIFLLGRNQIVEEL